jgi:hypothetical protein
MVKGAGQINSKSHTRATIFVCQSALVFVYGINGVGCDVGLGVL